VIHGNDLFNALLFHVGNPYFFNEEIGGQPTLQQRLRVMVEHTKLFDELLAPVGKPLAYMRKHYKAYVSGFQDAKAWRAKLMDAKDTNEIEQIVDELLNLIDSGKIQLSPGQNVQEKDSSAAANG